MIVRPQFGNFDPVKVGLPAFWAEADRGYHLDEANHDSQQDNLSGGNYNLNQNDPAARPAYLSNQINGHPVLQFDGSDDILSNATFYLPGAFTMLAVYRNRRPSGGASSVCLFPQNSDFSRNAELIITNLLGGYTSISFTADHSGVASAMGASPAGVNGVYGCIIWGWNGNDRSLPGNYFLRFNGNPQTVGYSNALAFGAGARHLSIGGRPTAPITGLLGEIVAILLYPRMVAVAACQYLENGYRAKYALW